MFIESTPKLFEMSDALQARLKVEDRELYNFLLDNEIILEIVLSNSLMSLFANTTNFSVTTHILNCFILDGESYILDLLLNVYKSFRFSIMNFNDSHEIIDYMSKLMFVHAEKQSKYYEGPNTNIISFDPKAAKPKKIIKQNPNPNPPV